MHDGFYFHHAVLLLLFLSMNNLCPEAVHPRGPAEGGAIIIIIIIMHLITIASDGVTKPRSYYYLSYYFYQ